MSSEQSVCKSNPAADRKSKKGHEEGKIYEKLSLALLAKNGYELSKDKSSNFCNFAIGREVFTGRDGKFDDVVFRFTDQHNKKNLIFVQIKHKQDDRQIDSQVLSAEASRAKDGGKSGMPRDFNLQKYFISYLDVRANLNANKTQSSLNQELQDGEIKYVVIFTNVGLNIDELEEKGFRLKKAPDDVIRLFTIKKSPFNPEESSHFYQFHSISEDLHRLFKKSSDLNRLARVLAKYVVWENYRKKNILGTDESPVKYFHVALGREVIKKSGNVQNPSNKSQNLKNTYCEAQYRDDFVDSDETGPKLDLRVALFEAIRELDESKKSLTDDELKSYLKKVRWNVVPHFGQCKQIKKENLVGEWMTVKDEYITDFLKSLVFIVHQPRTKELDILFNLSARGTVVENTLWNQALDKIDSTGPEFRKNIETVLGIYEKANSKEKWISKEKIFDFIEEQKQLINIYFIASAVSQMYESEISKYGKFKTLGKLEACLDNFQVNSAQILIVNTAASVLSSVKILQYLNTEERYATYYRISINLDILRNNEIRECITKAFDSKSNYLLLIECRYSINEQDIQEFFCILRVTIERNPENKIIIVNNNDHGKLTLLEKLTKSFLNIEQFILEDDFISIRNFEPMEDPFKKRIIIFQGQREKTNLAELTGIDSWGTYVKQVSQYSMKNTKDNIDIQETDMEDIQEIDIQTIVEILMSHEIEVGSKPLGTSSLEGAYATLFEKINKKTLINKLILERPDSSEDDIYIISGISGSSEEEKINNLIHYLGLVKDQEKIKNQYGDIGSDFKLQIAHDDFKNDHFKQICCDHPWKRIFWMFVKTEIEETKFFLQQFYNPKFYVKRKFENVVVKKSIKELLIEKRLSETFIFYPVNDLQELTNSLQLCKTYEKEQFKKNSANGTIKFFASENDAEESFQEKCKQNSSVHLLKFEEKLLIWCNSFGSVYKLQDYIKIFDKNQSEISLIEEEQFLKQIELRKVVIIADEPGMGKSTTLTKLYEAFVESHWIFRMNLKDHLQAIRVLELNDSSSDILNIIKFLSSVDFKLKCNLAKTLLQFTLQDKKIINGKFLLFAFDGFDEVLDENDRVKIISLFEYLNSKSSAKVWITTRRHYQKILEQKLSSLAFQLYPMDDRTKLTCIKNYFQNHCYLILNEKKYAESFILNEELSECESILVYTTFFLNKMKSIFRGNAASFIGTPLQLYLMLEGSIRYFKDWIENPADKDPNFDYLGTDILEVYDKFIDRKYDVYFKKMDVKESVLQEQGKFVFNKFSKDFAKSLILNSKPKVALKRFEAIVLLAGLIKSNDSSYEFIHATFRDYFAAEMFSQWIRKVVDKISYSSKQEYLLKEVLKEAHYKQVRTFINFGLKKLSETESYEEILKHYGMIFERLFTEQKKLLLDDDLTVLSIAALEGNKFTVRFLLNSLKEHTDILTEFLFHKTEDPECSALYWAFLSNDVEIVRCLLDAPEGISKDTLQNFLHFSHGFGGFNAFYTAILCTRDFEIYKEILNRAENKLHLICSKEANNKKLLLEFKNFEFVEFIFQYFKHDENSVKQLLLFFCVKYIFRDMMDLYDENIFEYLLHIAKEVKDNNETLKNMLISESGCSLSFAIRYKKNDLTEIILNAAKDINDDNHTLKQLLLDDKTIERFIYAIRRPYTGGSDLVKLILETAANLDSETFMKLIFSRNGSGNDVMFLMLECEFENILIYILERFEEDKHNDDKKIIIQTIVEERQFYYAKKCFISSVSDNKIDEVRDMLSKAKNCQRDPSGKLRRLLLDVVDCHNTLHTACYLGHADIIKELLSYAININDGGKTLKRLIAFRNSIGLTPFDVLKDGCATEVGHIINALIIEARNNKNKTIVTNLKKIRKKYLGGRVSAQQIFSFSCFR